VIPGTCPITFVRGDDWAMTVDVNDSTETPIPLTGWTFRAQIRKKVADKNVLVDLDVTLDSFMTNRLILRLASEDTEVFTTTSGVWDLELTDPSGTVQTVLAGKVTIILDVTRDAVTV
jgi:hypothetical protein